MAPAGEVCIVRPSRSSTPSNRRVSSGRTRSGGTPRRRPDQAEPFRHSGSGWVTHTQKRPPGLQNAGGLEDGPHECRQCPSGCCMRQRDHRSFYRGMGVSRHPSDAATRCACRPDVAWRTRVGDPSSAMTWWPAATKIAGDPTLPAADLQRVATSWREDQLEERFAVLPICIVIRRPRPVEPRARFSFPGRAIVHSADGTESRSVDRTGDSGCGHATQEDRRTALDRGAGHIDRVSAVSTPLSQEAVIFDLDGVLIDTEATLYSVWSQVFSGNMDAAFRERSVACAARHERRPREPVHVARAARRSVSTPVTRRATSAIRATEQERVAALGPMPGVEDWLAEAVRARVDDRRRLEFSSLLLGACSSRPTAGCRPVSRRRLRWGSVSGQSRRQTYISLLVNNSEW